MDSKQCYKLTFEQELSKISADDDSYCFADQDDVVKTATLPGTMSLVISLEYFQNLIRPYTSFIDLATHTDVDDEFLGCFNFASR